MSAIFNFKLVGVFSILLLMGFGNSDLNKKSGLFNSSNEYKLLEEKKAIFISIKDQKLYVFYKKTVLKEFKISSSKYGIGNDKGSQKTPIGLHYIKKKIGGDVPLNGILNYQKFNGEVSIPDHPKFMNKDLITTRILWLPRKEGSNQFTYDRHIYIHGTPEEVLIGSPSSHGCIRMRNADVYALYEFVDNGTHVYIH